MITFLFKIKVSTRFIICDIISASSRSHLEQLMFERDKLRTDVLHANKRASLIAAEIDENYSKIETSVQSQLKLVEDKHGETIRRLNEALNSEREALINLTAKYEKEVKEYQDNISALAGEMAEKQKVSR